MKSNLLFLTLLYSFSIMSQDTTKTIVKKGFKYNNLFDLGFSVGDRQYVVTADWNHLHGVGKKKRFKIGYGVRWSGFIGSGSKIYTTAPAKLTSGQEGPQVLFSDYVNSNIDTVRVNSPYVGMVNLCLAFQYTFFKKLDLGFNIDVVGLSYGSKVQSNYYYNSSHLALVDPLPGTPYNGLPQDAAPTTLNLLLVSDNDIGGLNSELFLRYWINDKWAIKGVFTYIFTEFTTTNTLRLENDRFRNKATLFGLGVTYCPWK